MVDGFEVHEDSKSAGNGEPPNDHDLRYARLLEAITKSAFATREEVAATREEIASGVDRIEKHTTDQIGELTTDFVKLQVAFHEGIKNCNDRIRQQEDKFDDSKT